MRKHRGKRIDTGEWVYGWLIPSLGNQVRIFQTGLEAVKYDHLNKRYLYSGEGFEVDPKTVGMCTGLPDKNGL